MGFNQDVRTRAQLYRDGVLLLGPIVPEWFKERCDNCSAPNKLKGKFMVSQLTSACRIHDLRFTMIPYVFEKGSLRREARRHADSEFLENCRVIVGARGAYRVRGFFLTRTVYATVRMFGRWAMKEPNVTGPRMPKTTAELEQWLSIVDNCYVETFESRINKKNLERYVKALEGG
jgi:hypothetical protein